MNNMTIDLMHHIQNEVCHLPITYPARWAVVAAIWQWPSQPDFVATLLSVKVFRPDRSSEHHIVIEVKELFRQAWDSEEIIKSTNTFCNQNGHLFT